MYVVTRGNTYQGKALEPGDALDARNICPSIVQVLIRQGLVRDVAPDEAAEIKATWQQQKAEAARRHAETALVRRLREKARLEDERDRLNARACEIQARLVDVDRDITDHRALLCEAVEAAKPAPKPEPQSEPPKATNEDWAILEGKLAGMSAKQLTAYARKELALDGELPSTKVKLIPLILEAAKR